MPSFGFRGRTANGVRTLSRISRLGTKHARKVKGVNDKIGAKLDAGSHLGEGERERLQMLPLIASAIHFHRLQIRLFPTRYPRQRRSSKVR